MTVRTRSATMLEGDPDWCEYTPHVALAPFVSSYWTLELRAGRQVVRTLPDTCIDLTVDLTTGSAKAYVTGPQPRAKRRVITTGLKVIAAKLLPGAAVLLGAQPDTLSPDWTPLSRCVDSSIVATFEASMQRAATTEARLAVLDAFLLERLVLHAPKVDPRLSQALEAVFATSGDVSMAALAKHSAMSQRGLQRVFVKWVGLAPKRFARIVRFQAALRAFHGQKTCADALMRELGYFDQPHLIRDMNELFGASPSEALRLLPDTR